MHIIRQLGPSDRSWVPSIIAYFSCIFQRSCLFLFGDSLYYTEGGAFADALSATLLYGVVVYGRYNLFASGIVVSE